jgi:hypothetical protein
LLQIEASNASSVLALLLEVAAIFFIHKNQIQVVLHGKDVVYRPTDGTAY